MKLNNKGFAITAILYGILILFVFYVGFYLLALSTKKDRIEELTSEIENEYNNILLVDYIEGLYENATKEVVTNNGIEYNYASSVSLMNDGLGGGITGKYKYDALANSFEGCYNNFNCDVHYYDLGFEDITSCYNYFYNHFNVSSVEEICTVNVYDGNIRYYGANPNNYIDIGDVYKEDLTINNWEKLGINVEDQATCYYYFDCESNWDSVGYSSVAECQANIYDYYGTTNVDDICGITEHFKDEPILYRIIGVFKDVELSDGSITDLVKIIRNDSIGNYSWDTNESNGDFIWEQADLMKLLNDGYESETIGGSLWWNSSSGNCYVDSNNGTKACDFSKNGLTSSVQDKVISVVWNLGSYPWTLSKYTNEMYVDERWGIYSTYSEGYFPNEWTGKVALMSPGDYGYAVDFNNCNKTLDYYNDDACNDNWLKNNQGWTLISVINDNPCVHFIEYNGSIDDQTVFHSNAVYPTLFLDSELRIISGTGTGSDPYIVNW